MEKLNVLECLPIFMKSHLKKEKKEKASNLGNRMKTLNGKDRFFCRQVCKDQTHTSDRAHMLVLKEEYNNYALNKWKGDGGA